MIWPKGAMGINLKMSSATRVYAFKDTNLRGHKRGWNHAKPNPAMQTLHGINNGFAKSCYINMGYLFPALARRLQCFCGQVRPLYHDKCFVAFILLIRTRIVVATPECKAYHLKSIQTWVMFEPNPPSSNKDLDAN